jgi:hypothetical protein
MGTSLLLGSICPDRRLAVSAEMMGILAAPGIRNPLLSLSNHGNAVPSGSGVPGFAQWIRSNPVSLAPTQLRMQLDAKSVPGSGRNQARPVVVYGRCRSGGDLNAKRPRYTAVL